MTLQEALKSEAYSTSWAVRGIGFFSDVERAHRAGAQHSLPQTPNPTPIEE